MLKTVRRRHQIIATLLFGVLGCFESPQQFEATILDANTGKPLPGCNVKLTTYAVPLLNFDSGRRVKATGRTQSDEWGKFSLSQKYRSIDTLLITKEDYYPIHYGQHELNSWPDKFELHSVEDPQDLPIITSCFKELIQQSSQEEGKIELPSGYPLSLHLMRRNRVEGGAEC